MLVGAETLRDRHVAVSDAVSENPPENWITHLITGALTNAYVGYLVHKGHALSDAIEASEDPVLRYQLLHQSMEDKDKALNMALTLFSQIRGDKPREAT